MHDAIREYLAGLDDLPSVTFEITWPYPHHRDYLRARSPRFCVTCYQESRRTGARSLRATVAFRQRRRWNRKRRKK